MSRTTSAVLPLADAAQTLTEQIRSVLELYPQEIGRAYGQVTDRLDVAIDALAELIEALALL